MRYPGSEMYPKCLVEKFHTMIFFDLETTGLDAWRCEILTASVSAVDFYTLRRKASIELTFRPQNLAFWDYIAPGKRRKPLKKASEIHGISLSQALYFDGKEQSTTKMMDFIGDHCHGSPQIMVCHAFDNYGNVALMDVAFLMAHLVKMDERIGSRMREHLYQNIRFFESTETYFREARRRGYYRVGGSDLLSYHDPEDPEGEDFKLPTICKYYKIPMKKHHNAQYDRECCEALYATARGLGTNDEEESLNLGEG